VLAQEGLFVEHAGLDVVMSARIGEVGMDSGVGECAVLSDGRGLQGNGPEVSERIAAGIVVVIVSADEGAEVKNRVVADDVVYVGEMLKVRSGSADRYFPH